MYTMISRPEAQVSAQQPRQTTTQSQIQITNWKHVGSQVLIADKNSRIDSTITGIYSIEEIRSTKLVKDLFVANEVVIIKKRENVGSQVLIADKTHNSRIYDYDNIQTYRLNIWFVQLYILTRVIKYVYRVQFSALLKSFLKNHRSHSNKLACIF